MDREYYVEIGLAMREKHGICGAVSEDGRQMCVLPFHHDEVCGFDPPETGGVFETLRQAAQSCIEKENATRCVHPVHLRPLAAGMICDLFDRIGELAEDLDNVDEAEAHDRLRRLRYLLEGVR